MTAPAGHPVRARRRSGRVRWAGALAAAVALATLVGLPGVARAAGPGYDQMSGIGPTASAITVPWTQGLLDNNNQSIASANADRTSSSPTSPLSFMYPDFKNLKVTVSQTQDLGHQGITVSWTGGEQTSESGGVQANFLQMMECYGDSSSGPNPEQCEYGSAGLLPSGATNIQIGERAGNLCPPHSVPSVTNPPRSVDGTLECDPLEPSDPTHLGPCPGPNCSSSTFIIPFAPSSDPANLAYDPGTTYFNQFNTDEVQEAVTSAGGGGQLQFETLTGVQAPGLGCGLLEANGQPRGCWLVIVPRGQYEPNGYKINLNSASSVLNTSPLSASNWAQRVQIHLGFASVPKFCPISTLERQTLGTQVVTRAMQSWQIALNSAAKCAKVYGFTAVPEVSSTLQLSAPGGAAGLAFTTIPIGSEATRLSGGSGGPSDLPPILYAPVAIAALDFGFNIDFGAAGYIANSVKLTPSLLAKAVTQSYRTDLPDYYPSSGRNGPTWAQSNPIDISTDPTFHNLNQEVPQDPTGPVAPLLAEDHSALNQQVWQWIQASPAATKWLAGTPDTADQNMAIDPAYQALNLGHGTAIDSYPRAYNTCLDLGKSPGSSPKEESKCSLDLLPYTDNFDSAAAAVVTANNPDESGEWNTTAQAPDGSSGWWEKRGVEAAGQIFMWAADDTPDLAAYGLVPAQLCSDDHSACVGPTTASVTTAVNAAKPDSQGLLQVNPAHPGNGGYPLVSVVYAAVRTNNSAAALDDYANLIAYAAGPGQTPGAAPGNLPPGYLPLPASLQAQAQAVVAKLRALASGGSHPSPPPTQASAPGGTTGNTTGNTAGNTTGSAVSGPTPGTTAAPSASPSATRPAVTTAQRPGGAATSRPPTRLIAGITPKQLVGGIRWALLAVVIAGGACAVGGTLLRSPWTPEWPGRRRTGIGGSP